MILNMNEKNSLHVIDISQDENQDSIITMVKLRVFENRRGTDAF